MVLWGKAHVVLYSFLYESETASQKEKSPTFLFHCFHKCWDSGTYKPHSHAAGQLPPLSFTVLKNSNTSALDSSHARGTRSCFMVRGWCTTEIQKRHLCTVTILMKPCGCDQAEADISNEHRRSCGAVHSHASTCGALVSHHLRMWTQKRSGQLDWFRF